MYFGSNQFRYGFCCQREKVLLLDATFGRSGVYQRLGLPESYGNTMEDCLRMFAGGRDISQMPLGKTISKTGMNMGSISPRACSSCVFG